MAAKKTTVAGGASCAKCGKTGHVARACRVTWKRAWPGMVVMRLGIRTEEGGTIEIESPLSPEQAKRAAELLNEVIRNPVLK